MSAEMPALDAIVINVADQVATALRRIQPGETVRIKSPNRIFELELRERIELCHKFAISHVSTGDEVRKYGETIGVATSDIPAGRHVHIHNLQSLRARTKAGRLAVRE